MALTAARKTFVSRFGFVVSGKSRGIISTFFVAALFLRKKSNIDATDHHDAHRLSDGTLLKVSKSKRENTRVFSLLPYSPTSSGSAGRFS